MQKDKADRMLVRIVQEFNTLRIAQGLSHESMEQKSGVTRPAISHIECGKRKPSLLLSLRLAGALDKNLSDVVRSAEEGEKSK